MIRAQRLAAGNRRAASCRLLRRTAKSASRPARATMPSSVQMAEPTILCSAESTSEGVAATVSR
jgi:hypothetical protein